MASQASVVKLTDTNYHQWSIEIQDALGSAGLWPAIVRADEFPLPPIPPPTEHNPRPTWPDLATWDRKPESTDPAYIKEYKEFCTEWRKFSDRAMKATATIRATMSTPVRLRYGNTDYDLSPKTLWNDIKSYYDAQIKLDGMYELTRLDNCQLIDFPSVAEWIVAQDQIIENIATTGMEVNEGYRCHYIIKNLPDTPEWTAFVDTLTMIRNRTGTGSSTGNVKLAELIAELMSFETRLRRRKGLAPGDALFVTRKGKKHNTTHEKASGDSDKKRKLVTCYGCGIKGHKKNQCRHPEKWDDKNDPKKKSTANSSNMAQGESAAAGASGSDSDVDRDAFVFGTVSVSVQDTSSSDPFDRASPDFLDEVSVQQDMHSVAYSVASTSASDSTRDWVLDSGASDHISGDRSAFHSYRSYRPGERQIKTASNEYINVAGIGNVHLDCVRGKLVTLTKVLHVLECGSNHLLSIGQAMRKGLQVDLSIEKGAMLSYDGRHLANAPINGNIWTLSTYKVQSSANAVISSPVDEKDITLWHCRLGHASLPAVKKAVTTAAGFELHKRSPDNCVCEACILGKLYRKPFKRIDKRKAVSLLEVIHSDVMGPMATQSLGGKRYAITFTDELSRYTMVYFMAKKEEAPTIFQQYKAEVENQLNAKIKKIMVDGGGEYSSKQFLKFLADEGIVKLTTAPYTAQQNGISERCNRSIMDPARAMMKHAGLPNLFWAEAVNTAVYIKNRLPSRASPDKTAYERWHGDKPDIKHMRTFGCLAYAWNPDIPSRKKLDDRATRTVLLGYGSTSSHYRLYDVANKRYFISRDVRFDETLFYKDLIVQPGRVIIPIADDNEDDSTDEDEPDSDPPVEEIQHLPDKPCPQPLIDLDIEAPGEVVSVQPNFKLEHKRTKHSRLLKELDTDLKNSAPKISSRTRSGAHLAVNNSSASESHTSVGMAFMVEPGPRSYKSALADREAEGWLHAIDSEKHSLVKHDAFQFLPPGEIPKDANVIEGKWVMQRKLNTDGSTNKLKTRLVARGDLQIEGIDYTDITSPVIDSAIIRYALGKAVQQGYHIAVLDVPTAFLGSRLEETIYMRLPECDWTDMDPYKRKRPVVRLLATLYGLKQAGRYWFEDVYDFAVDKPHGLGMTGSVTAPGYFFSEDYTASLLLYVDDMMIIAKTKEHLDQITDLLYNRFRAAGQVVHDKFQYLGMNIEIDRENRNITIDQSGYLSRILDKFGMMDSNSCANPLEQRPRKKILEESEADIKIYRQAIGSLLYAALGSRPDIAYAVGLLGRYAANPSTAHMQCVKHLLRYIKGTINRKLVIYRPGLTSISPSSSQIVAYADADLGGDPDDSKSTSGYVIYVDGILITWKSKKQSITAQSTMHAELIATASAKRVVDWLTDFFTECSSSSFAAPIIFNDNQACVTVLSSGNFKGDNRHLRLRYYGIYEAIAKGTLEVKHMPGTDMVADGLTKPLAGIGHEKFMKMVGLE